ncbi:hypothetical protein ACH4RA_17855 [Streptomyces smyrnaeus]|uniref:hypothetical protein n=1 Tax=Streptomyces TaxID=1883 RepID=UPI00117DCF17|nr:MULTISPECIES: hypothetical protein [unclassified Streptomyces]MBQ0866894.1 hypothetical protein [Streptomyces sp. RK75]MBQ1124248.1 hypothetical protein [Streptomyces sp. B15]
MRLLRALQRNTIERCTNNLKQRRGLATRHDKTVTACLAGLHVAAIFLCSARPSSRNGRARNDQQGRQASSLVVGSTVISGGR